MRAYYYEKVSKFINTSEHEILGQLLMKHNFSDDMEQKRAWAEQISILKQNLFDFPEATLFFEFSIPRMGKRVDNILLLNGIIYLLEFKISAENYHNSAIEQVVDYALDLKNFHSGSHNKTIVPILISTKAKEIENEIFFAEDKISNCLKTNATNFGKVIKKINIQCGKEQFNVKDWMNSSYKPTPTIIEAGQALYANHTVEDISRHGAEAINLTLTKNAVNEIIKNSKTYNQKSICFITGVPGAGKTLAGLDIATHSKNHNKDDEHACFLSGNGPLVNVLKEALIRNNIISEKISKKKAAAKLDSFIQNIHHFRDEYVENLNPPSEKIIIFDEAQRAWNKEKTSKFMDKKHKLKNFEYSEPELLIGVMDRHPNWCVIVCLIGEGQEINTGEAGLEEWFKALNEKYPHWEIYCSSITLNRAGLKNEYFQMMACGTIFDKSGKIVFSQCADETSDGRASNSQYGASDTDRVEILSKNLIGKLSEKINEQINFKDFEFKIKDVNKDEITLEDKSENLREGNAITLYKKIKTNNSEYLIPMYKYNVIEVSKSLAKCQFDFPYLDNADKPSKSNIAKSTIIVSPNGSNFYQISTENMAIDGNEIEIRNLDNFILPIIGSGFKKPLALDNTIISNKVSMINNSAMFKKELKIPKNNSNLTIRPVYKISLKKHKVKGFTQTNSYTIYAGVETYNNGKKLTQKALSQDTTITLPLKNYENILNYELQKAIYPLLQAIVASFK